MTLRPFLIGLAAGQRSITPLAAAALAARAHRLPPDNGAPRFFGCLATAVGFSALAVGELLGDKMPSAPDRTVPAGLAARLLSGALAGASLAPRQERGPAAVMGAAGAILGGYLGLAARKRAMRRFGQTRSGMVEDMLTLGATTLLSEPGVPRPGGPARGRHEAAQSPLALRILVDAGWSAAGRDRHFPHEDAGRPRGQVRTSIMRSPIAIRRSDRILRRENASTSE